MRHFLFLLFFGTAWLAAHAAATGIHSHLLIDPGKQFVLGGDQVGAFQVRARNSGQQPVLLLERADDQRAAVPLGRLEPGQSARLSFAAGAAVLVRNLGRGRAELDVDIKGPSNSRMTYEPTAN